KPIVVPLEVDVPRLQWAVSGLSRADSLHWQDRPITISLQKLEEAQEARLLVRGDFGQDISCELSLQGAEHRKSFAFKHGKGVCPLAPFLDSVRESGRSRNDFYLELFFPGEKSSRSVQLLQVETKWIIEDLQVEQEIVLAESKRVILFGWR